MTNSCANPRPCEPQTHRVRALQFHVRHWPGDESEPLRVIVHGWMDVSATWQRLVDHLPEHWRIAAPDQRGFGYSESSGDTYWFYDYIGDLDGLLSSLSPDRPVDLIGHSMGAQVAALYAGVRPERIRRLVLLDGFYLPVSPPTRAPEQLRNWLQELNQTQEPRYYADLQSLADKIAKRQPGLNADEARQVAECWSHREDDGRYRLLGDGRHRQRGPLLYRDEEALAVFSAVQAPTLILDAAKSYLAGASREELRRARLACFKHSEHDHITCGHMMHFDAPQATAQRIQQFLEAPALLPTA